MNRLRARVLLALSTLVVLDQLLQYTALRDGDLLGRRIAPFDPPVFSPSQRDSLARIRAHVSSGQPPLSAFDFDAELGWCTRRESEEPLYRFDWAGSRVGTQPLARARQAGVRRAVAIGCSYTLGIAVAGPECWVSVLDAQRDDLEVANLGVGAYGIDQALLRWRRDGTVLAGDEVWLGILPDALPRVLTTYPPALRHWSFSVAFKPRFRVAADDQLQLVENPARSLQHIDGFLRSQNEFLAAVGTSDHWVASSPAAYAPAGSVLAHHSSLARLVLSAWERRGRESAELLADADGELFRLVRALVKTTRSEVEASGARLRIWILPDEHDLDDLVHTGRTYWRELVQALEADGAEVYDVTPALIAEGGASNRALWAGEGHLSAAGNALVAAALERHLAAAR